MSIILFQTADPVRYREMLEATSRTAIEFCRRHGHGYESYVGIKRGVHPWQATFNRMFQYQELVARGFRGWGLYLDADAYVHDLDFNLAGYLADKLDRAAVLVPSGDTPDMPWNINAGVTLVNLGHPLGRDLVARWLALYQAKSDGWIAGTAQWPEDDNDQYMLFSLLRDHVELREAVHYESRDLINSDHARFIRQKLRAYLPDQAERTRALKLITDEVLGGSTSEGPAAQLGPLVATATYRALLHRDPDSEGLAGFSAHVRARGLERGIEEMIAAIADSPEYRALRERRA
ncbi:hypothetical protein [Sphingomonas quercus]|uniref:DUF4214 domain-containing protein n=1 Tax=Sphingomonas quercus TaxID=2842451 RepID=A0ABS6BFA2_9SPHN|nr:hypothetical protein [Sphingomonas quercus]MBU3076980.1 hypothetical protein [Sphingomonas quercus]